ncbi:MAG: hypothetical protein ABI759_23195 [Candidatus Solibacter sp.]
MAIAVVLIAGLAGAQGQKKSTAKKVAGAVAQECARGAICFSGEVRDGQQFHKDLNAELQFVLKLPGGIDVVSKRADTSCQLSSWVANPPLRAHHDTEIDAAYDWTAEQEVARSLREFRFAINCDDFDRLVSLSETSALAYFDNLERLAKGQGRLWITGSRVTHAHGAVSGENGAVEWMSFSVEIRLPASR